MLSCEGQGECYDVLKKLRPLEAGTTNVRSGWGLRNRVGTGLKTSRVVVRVNARKPVLVEL